ncbi:MAG: hypothetical protein V3T58_00290 [Candidatus Hydrothermarchaeales archaeon]
MGYVLDSLKRSLSIVKENPPILAVSFVYALISTPIAILPRLFPKMVLSLPIFLLLAVILFMIFIAPFFTGGLYGMAIEAIERPINLSTFIKEGKRNYVSLFIAFFLFFVLIFGLQIGLMMGSFFAAGILKDIIPLSRAVLAFITVLFTIVILPILMFFLQFFDIGIVANHYGAIETFRKSFGFARARLLTVFWYTILRFLIMIPLIIPNVLVSIYTPRGMQEAGQIGVFGAALPTGLLLLWAVANLVLGALIGAIQVVFPSVFYTQSQAQQIFIEKDKPETPLHTTALQERPLPY